MVSALGFQVPAASSSGTCAWSGSRGRRWSWPPGSRRTIWSACASSRGGTAKTRTCESHRRCEESTALTSPLSGIERAPGQQHDAAAEQRGQRHRTSTAVRDDGQRPRVVSSRSGSCAADSMSATRAAVVRRRAGDHPRRRCPAGPPGAPTRAPCRAAPWGHAPARAAATGRGPACWAGTAVSRCSLPVVTPSRGPLPALPVAPRVLGLQRYRRSAQRLARRTRQRQPELRAAARLAPRLQPAAVQPGVLDGDGQPEARAAGGTGPRRVGPPEAVEDPGRLAGLEPDAVVPHGDGDRAARRAPAAPRRPGPRRARRR